MMDLYSTISNYGFLTKLLNFYLQGDYSLHLSGFQMPDDEGFPNDLSSSTASEINLRRAASSISSAE